jgi:hypothetical protein
MLLHLFIFVIDHFQQLQMIGFEIVKLGTKAWFSIVTVAPEVLLLSTKFAFA